MKFCLYTWSVRKHTAGDAEGKPTGTKQVQCDLEHGHKGDHRTGKVTSPNIRARGVPSGAR